jgi:hypothetical protein
MYTRLTRPASLLLLAGSLAGACGGESTKLTVTAIEPATGDADGGSLVHVRGTRFQADGPRDVKIYFGGRPGNVHRFLSDNDLLVEAPGGKANEAVDVLVRFEPGGQITLTGAFKYHEHHQGAGPSVDDLNIGGKGSAKK